MDRPLKNATRDELRQLADEARDRHKQRDLFDAVDSTQHVGYVAGSDTSKAAAVEIAPLVGGMKEELFEWIIKRPDFIAEEAQLSLGWKHQTCSARVRELVLLGYVEDSGDRRATTSGRSARIYKLTAKGEAEKRRRQ